VVSQEQEPVPASPQPAGEQVGLPVTSYALLGLLTLGDGLTGYELKQRADRTLRFYWVAPAMSQVYSELNRLSGLGLVDAQRAGSSRRSTRYLLTAAGRAVLHEWMTSTPVEFPTLKHPVALRLLMGHLVDPETTTQLLEDYLVALAERRAELQAVRDTLRGRDAPGERYRHPSLVAEWGLGYFESERAIVEELLERLDER
jgi:DNA-binding PadR family transcriptional regulator